ncbi:sulfite exporter TauE/SafE family protein [Novipirellula artificiosorum]|uniref:Probable membrane transporter protein n=1 Tax=Novipirellula artificiosorum TaxID=2528016 RepID=A0A5C6E2A6_9BACT|nr:sulfite exporter TauE/SafE family protein [Novipirellula artificiosorum]TWU42855.1 Sulfite exporter TauE/SafE [Novipirellula artificiosorum]
MHELYPYLPFALILCLGIFVQSAAGFAAGLLTIPVLLWFGYSIPEAQTSLLVATIPQNLWGVWSFRDAIDVSKVTWPGLTRILFVPVGIVVLQTLETFSIVTLRQFVGGVVLIVTLTIVFFNPKPRASLHPIWACLTFPTSGFLQGLVGMGGPPMVFWVQAHDWDTRKMRGFLFAAYLISLFPALGFLYGGFGTRIIEPGIIAASLTPLLLLATYAGLKLGTWLGRVRLRRITLALLVLIGIAGLAAPLFSHH